MKKVKSSKFKSALYNHKRDRSLTISINSIGVKLKTSNIINQWLKPAQIQISLIRHTRTASTTTKMWSSAKKHWHMLKLNNSRSLCNMSIDIPCIWMGCHQLSASRTRRVTWMVCRSVTTIIAAAAKLSTITWISSCQCTTRWRGTNASWVSKFHPTLLVRDLIVAPMTQNLPTRFNYLDQMNNSDFHTESLQG